MSSPPTTTDQTTTTGNDEMTAVASKSYAAALLGSNAGTVAAPANSDKVVVGFAISHDTSGASPLPSEAFEAIPGQGAIAATPAAAEVTIGADADGEPAMSDEELARMLQEQFDAEAGAEAYGDDGYEVYADDNDGYGYDDAYGDYVDSRRGGNTIELGFDYGLVSDARRAEGLVGADDALDYDVGYDPEDPAIQPLHLNETYRTEIRRFARPSDKLRPEEEVFICEIDQTGFTVMVGYAIERRVDFDERQATNAGILDALADAFENARDERDFDVVEVNERKFGAFRLPTPNVKQEAYVAARNAAADYFEEYDDGDEVYGDDDGEESGSAGEPAVAADGGSGEEGSSSSGARAAKVSATDQYWINKEAESDSCYYFLYLNSSGTGKVLKMKREIRSVDELLKKAQRKFNLKGGRKGKLRRCFDTLGHEVTAAAEVVPGGSYVLSTGDNWIRRNYAK